MIIKQDDLEILIGNVLDAFGDVEPSRILVKIKLHLLPHLINDIHRFWPAIRNSTEVFEGFNDVFRLCSIFSNRQAPSHDIARKFASMNGVKHLLSGGYYWSESKNDWVQAGESVLKILHSMQIIQHHLGWVPPSKIQPGTILIIFYHSSIHYFQGIICPKSKRKYPSLCWDSTHASAYPFCHLLHESSDIVIPSPDSLWRPGESVQAVNGDRVILGSMGICAGSYSKKTCL